MIDEDIKALLSPLVQGHVHPLRRPQRSGPDVPEELPVIVYSYVGDDWQTASTLCGPGLHDVRVQLDCYAAHYRDARNLAYAVADLMLTLGWLLNMQPFPDDDEKIYRWLVEFSVWRTDRDADIPPWTPLSLRKA